MNKSKGKEGKRKKDKSTRSYIMIYVCGTCAYPIDMIDIERKGKSPSICHRHVMHAPFVFVFFCFIVTPVHKLDNSVRPNQPKPVKHFISFQPNTHFLFFPVRLYADNQLYLIGKSSSLPVSLSYSFLGGPGC